MMSSSMAVKKLLVLGGTGFVGSRFMNLASKLNYQVYSLSRRGKVIAEDSSSKITVASSQNNKYAPIWISGDATDKNTIVSLIQTYGPFDAYVHAIGLLFDGKSGFGSLNRYVSGSQSVPGSSSSYDDITRKTAFNLIEAIEETSSTPNVPLVFISAAEAGWTFQAPVDFLERYLTAKRSVEARILKSTSQQTLRGTIMRPSLIWTWERPQALAGVIPFFIGSTIGLPFVDRPVRVESLVHAMMTAIQDPNTQGIQNYRNIDILSSKPLQNSSN
jgi:nucleoside-diphosphate-sugar epimerase